MSANALPAAETRRAAALFHALADETRLRLVARMATAGPEPIVRLSAASSVSRQAITKHLRVLEGAGVVRSLRVGRESRFELEPKRIDDVRRYLEHVSSRWDRALARLKAFVEDEAP
jgi:DNA-binding transcriptional ArsR family regulator